MQQLVGDSLLLISKRLPLLDAIRFAAASKRIRTVTAVDQRPELYFVKQVGLPLVSSALEYFRQRFPQSTFEARKQVVPDEIQFQIWMDATERIMDLSLSMTGPIEGFVYFPDTYFCAFALVPRDERCGLLRHDGPEREDDSWLYDDDDDNQVFVEYEGGAWAALSVLMPPP
jgi:hypothetical protein